MTVKIIAYRAYSCTVFIFSIKQNIFHDTLCYITLYAYNRTTYLSLLTVYTLAALNGRAANNESSEFFDIIKPGRRVKMKGFRQ